MIQYKSYFCGYGVGISAFVLVGISGLRLSLRLLDMARKTPYF
jgi:hypothetical protein